MNGVAPAASGGKLGRYELHGAIARGGMATVYVARMSGAAGFARTVAIKRLHPHLAADPTFSAMFIDEARLAARIRHPNVIDTLDVVAEGGELFLVMDFVLGETLAKLVRSASQRGITLPAPVVSSMVIGALEGLHAAHEATNERGEPLGIVHRDISPQNILIARDGVARVLDFGVAKAAGRVQETEGGEIKGKLAYMSPEQLTRKAIDRRCDIFAMGIVLWEALTSKRLFAGDDAASTLYAVMHEPIMPPSRLIPTLPKELDAVVLKALERDAASRYATAQEMALALEAACLPSPTRQTGKWVEDLAADALKMRAEIVRAIDHSQSGAGPISVPIDELTGSQALASSAFVGITTATEPFPAPSQPLPHDSAVFGLANRESSGVQSASGISNGSAMSNVTHTHTMPIGPAPAPDMSTRIAIVGGVFAAIAIIGIVMAVVALKARARANVVASPAPSTSVSVALATTAPPTPVTAPIQTAKPAPAPVAEVTEVPDAGTTTTTAPPTTAPPVAYTGPAPTHPAPHPAGKPAANECADPFTTDASGIRHPKIQCFNH